MDDARRAAAAAEGMRVFFEGHSRAFMIEG
jgi:hypothetical protein